MKNNLRGKIREFLASEDGKVGIKAPLTLGIASGSLLLAQMVFPLPADAGMGCWSDADCKEGESCNFWLEKVRGDTYMLHSSCG